MNGSNQIKGFLEHQADREGRKHLGPEDVAFAVHVGVPKAQLCAEVLAIVGRQRNVIMLEGQLCCSVAWNYEQYDDRTMTISATHLSVGDFITYVGSFATYQVLSKPEPCQQIQGRVLFEAENVTGTSLQKVTIRLKGEEPVTLIHSVG